MRETTANDIERMNVIILLLGSAISIVVMRDFKHFFSFALGSAMMTLNFRFLRKILEGFFAQSSLVKKELFIKLPLKFFGLVAFVAVVVIWGDVSVPFFVIGLSTVFFSLVISQVALAFRSEARGK
jgi:hypothetical protein